MSNTNTRIEWTDATWGPVTGCTKVSAGCAHCYAETFAHRGMGPWKGRAFTDVRCHPERLEQPLHWRKPRRVFVNSMSDLFHPDVPDRFVVRVFETMRKCYVLGPRHVFQILTKRPARMRDLCSRLRFDNSQSGRGIYLADTPDERGYCLMPQRGCTGLPDVWLGVSVEDQATADARIPALLQTPAAVRFVSAEPLLGPISFMDDDGPEGVGGPFSVLDFGMLHWVIVGGESGPKARPCDVGWIRSIVQQCKAAEVPCFVKQLGANPRCSACATSEDLSPCGTHGSLPWKGKANDPSEWPEDLRVREMPEVRR